MLRVGVVGLLVAALVSAGQAQPQVRPVLTRAEAEGLSRDPSAVLADPVAVAALAAFAAPLQKHAPPDPDGGDIGRVLDALPSSLSVPVQVSGVLLWIQVATDAPEEAYPRGMDASSELVVDRYVVGGDAELLTAAKAVCPLDGTGYRVWTVADVGPVEGCVASGE